MWRVLIFGLGVSLAAGPAHAGSSCSQVDATPRALTAALVPAAEKAFGLRNVDAAWVQETTVTRCVDGRLWACNAGANLPCGKANMVTILPAGDDWCRKNPNSNFIPAYITGHDNARQWRCSSGAPAITGPPNPVDAQGYLAQYWKILG